MQSRKAVVPLAPRAHSVCSHQEDAFAFQRRYTAAILPGFIRFGLMIAVEKPMPRLLQTLGQDRRNDRIGRERDHILARRVARVKHEDEINLFAEHAHFEVDQATVPRRLRDDLLQLLEARQDPREELSRFDETIEDEPAGPRNRLDEASDGRTAALANLKRFRPARLPTERSRFRPRLTVADVRRLRPSSSRSSPRVAAATAFRRLTAA